MKKWIVVKERETQRWIVVGLTEYYSDTYYPNGFARRAKKRQQQRSWVIPKPEHVSPFIEAHKVIEANTLEDVQCLISNWK